MSVIVPNANAGGATSALQHVRQTWTFVAGTTGSVATHTLFTISGRVWLDRFSAFATAALTSGGTPAITVGTTAQVANLLLAPTGGAPGVLINSWWIKAAQAAGSQSPVYTLTGGAVNSQRDILLSEDIVMVIPVSTVTGGTLVFDAWYLPITDGASLAAATPA